MEMSLVELYNSMGWFAKGVVWVMVVMSVGSWYVAFTKLWYLRKAQVATSKFAPEFSRFLQEEQLDGAIQLAEKKEYQASHEARVRGDPLQEG
jgi:biopolymer transport protein ExbB/biopolymer transport protein TolQ